MPDMIRHPMQAAQCSSSVSGTSKHLVRIMPQHVMKRFIYLVVILWVGISDGFVTRTLRHARGSSDQGQQEICPAFFSVGSALSSANHDDTTPLILHHTALRTRNITLAIQFYSLLGFETVEKFRAGPARAAWLAQPKAPQSRLELIEVPSYLLNEPEGMKRRALDLIQKSELLGQNHFALDVSTAIKEAGLQNLDEWLDSLNQKSLNLFGKTLRIAVTPQQQMIGSSVYKLAFLYDADGALVELLHKESDLTQKVSSGWEPWDGKDFKG